MTMRYCIGDIHGCRKTLEGLLQTLAPTLSDTIYFLGDYDRGPDSKGVLDLVMNMPNAVCLRGNHEQMLLTAHERAHDNEASVNWLVNGGSATLNSFAGAIGEEYLNFIRKMPLLIELHDYYLCHAGIGIDPGNTPEETLLWDRSCVVDTKRTGGRKVVVGHSPETIDVILASTRRNKILIDNGCFLKGQTGYGHLVALCLDDLRITIQTNLD